MRRAMIGTSVGITALACACSPTPASEPAAANDSTTQVYSSARHDFRVTTVADGLDHPWSMAWLPGGEMLIVERPGRVRVVRDGALQPDPVAGLPAVYRERGQGGFMDVLPHPDFAQNGWLYLSYGKPNADGSEGATAVVRGRWEADRVTDVEEIFEADAWGDNNNHFAGRMAFGADGYLYVAVGDRMVTPNALADHPALDLSNHMGTIVRLHDDGACPPTTRLSDGAMPSQRSGATATGTSRGSRSTRLPETSGRTSTALGAGTNSI